MTTDPLSTLPRYTPALVVVPRGDTFARVVNGRRVLVVVDEPRPDVPSRTFADAWGAR